MTYLTDLTVARNSLMDKLKELAADEEHGPNYSLDGRSIPWHDYLAMLRKEIEKLNLMIIKATGASEFSTIALS